MTNWRQPFLRTSVKTKSNSSPYCLNTGARSSIWAPSGRARIASKIWLGVRLATRSAVRGQCGSSDGGEQQVQVAGDVGHGSDRRSRIAAGSLLFDRDYGREAVHEVNVRLCHLRNKALGEGGERFHVPALPFGVDGVEGEARFARTRKTRHNDQPVARQSRETFLGCEHARPAPRWWCARRTWRSASPGPFGAPASGTSFRRRRPSLTAILLRLVSREGAALCR